MANLEDNLLLLLIEESKKQVKDHIKNPTKSDYEFALELIVKGAQTALRHVVDKEYERHLRRFERR